MNSTSPELTPEDALRLNVLLAVAYAPTLTDELPDEPPR